MTTFINNKMLRPAWVPPAVVRRRQTELAIGGPSRARRTTRWVRRYCFWLVAYRAIHGTNNQDPPAGPCPMAGIRMFNADVLDLYGLVSFGTKVIVNALSAGVLYFCSRPTSRRHVCSVRYCGREPRGLLHLKWILTPIVVRARRTHNNAEDQQAEHFLSPG